MEGGVFLFGAAAALVVAPGPCYKKGKPSGRSIGVVRQLAKL